MSKDELYAGREQTLVKHYLLENYLAGFAHVIGFHPDWDTITYVDCFSGPWMAQSQTLADTSFSIALEQLRRARQTHANRSKNLSLRCLFLEKDTDAFAKLQSFARDKQERHEHLKIECLNGVFEKAIGDILEFVKAGGKSSFPFIFIDPTGWKDISIGSIAPLLHLSPGEVLINLMTSFIHRFIGSPDKTTQAGFVTLFGDGVSNSKFKGLDGIDLDDAIVETFCDQVAAVGGFRYVRPAIVLHPEMSKTHFHLIYATRHRKGVEKFKEAEKRAMSKMESARAGVQHRKRKAKSGGQQELFSGDVLYDPSYYEQLRNRYTSRAQNKLRETLRDHSSLNCKEARDLTSKEPLVEEGDPTRWVKEFRGSLRNRSRLTYEDAWNLALKEPLVWESDLKQWIKEWKDAGLLAIEGLTGGQQVPKLDQGNSLAWKPQA